MSISEKTYDLKRFSRAMRRHPGDMEPKRDPDTLNPEDLKPCLQSAYIQILREECITITGIDFGAIGDGDIDDLESVLYYSPANRLFDICEVFKSFKPAAENARAFI